MKKSLFTGTMALLVAVGLTGCDVASLVGDDAGEFSSSTLYLKDVNVDGVAGIAYSCDGGYTDDGPLITSGTTSTTGGMSASYWPGYDLQCTITPIDTPDLYLYDANGPINNAQVDCDIFAGSIGQDGAINNEPTDTCTIRLMLN